MPKKQLKVKRAPTKQQLSRRQRERKIQRITLYAGISLISLVLVFIIFGFYNNEIRPLRKPAMKVNETIIRTEDYVDVLKLFLQDNNPVVRANIADTVLNLMQNNELIKQAAIKTGVIVTEAEINEALSKAKSPLGQERLRNLILADLYTKKTRENVALTVPVRSDQAHLLLMLIENREKAGEIRDKLNRGEEFASMAKQFSLDFASRDKGGDLGWLPRELMDRNIADVVFKIEPGTVSEPVSQEGSGNFYLLRVLDRKNDAEISSEPRDKMISQAFSNWVNGLKKEAAIDVYLNDKEKQRALELAVKK